MNLPALAGKPLFLWLDAFLGRTMTEEMVDFMIEKIIEAQSIEAESSKLKADPATQPPAALKTRSTLRKTL